MFEETSGPRLFGLAPGVDFPRALAKGLLDRLTAEPPEVLARTEIYLNTQRMRRRLHAILCESGARLLPRLRLLTDVVDMPGLALPPAMPWLRRRLELTRLVALLLEREPDLAPRAALFDLSDSLAALMDEMQGEGVEPEALERLDVSEHSRHWGRSLKFLRIVAEYRSAADAEARRRQAVSILARRWAETPPDHPVLVAGSTGSRGTTALFLQAVARLPQGAVILPGVDPYMTQAAWTTLKDALAGEDHPQFRYHRLCAALDVPPQAIRPWTGTAPPDDDRNRLISLSLRPAPVTDQWMAEGGSLPDLVEATRGLTLVEAQSPRDEALAIALILRRAAEDGRAASLISPDRMLTRQVTAALDRWGIRPDDSAGQPLPLSPPGRFLRQVAALAGRQATIEGLLALLKHPITASGAARGDHLRFTRALELRLRRRGPAFPGPEDLLAWADRSNDPAALLWARWAAESLRLLDGFAEAPLADHVARHITAAEGFARGPGGEETGELWQREAGAQAQAAVAELTAEADHGGVLGTFDYEAMFHSLLQRREVRQSEVVHPQIMIRGTVDARVAEAPLVILGGLNDGVWPPQPAADPWLNRPMRHDLGLLLPDRQIGLSAHDYQMAVAAPEVVLTRAIRDTEAETVPSRWLNRLTNLLAGLPERRGPEAHAAMLSRGARWLALAEALEKPQRDAMPEGRPSPRPPVAARPSQLAVTGIQTLIRDPYAIYARHVLGLSPLDPLHPAPDARLRGSVLHAILERFVLEGRDEDTERARDRLMAIADAEMAASIPWNTARRLWRARLDRAAPEFLALEAGRDGRPVLLEAEGRADVAPLDFTLTARPDRIDVLEDGRLQIFDYKTGSLPSQKQQRVFDKQLLLEAALAERGAFERFGRARVARVTYLGLATPVQEQNTEITDEITGQVWRELVELLSRYADRGQGYTARRAVEIEGHRGDYDHLARFGEWELSDPPHAEDVG